MRNRHSLPVCLFIFVRQQAGKDVVGGSARNQLALINIAEEMDGTLLFIELQLDAECMQRNLIVTRPVGNRIIRNICYSNCPVLGRIVFRFPDILDTLARTADCQIELVRIQIGRCTDQPYALILNGFRGGSDRNVGHGEPDRHRLSHASFLYLRQIPQIGNTRGQQKG